MKMTAFIGAMPAALVAEQKTARLALVLPVLAQAARRAPTMRAWVNAAVMPLSLKLPEGFMPLVLQEQVAGVHADVAGERVGPLEDRLALADGHDLLGRGVGQQFAEAPHAAEAERVGAARPLRLEVAQARAAPGGGPSRRRRP